MAEIRNIAFDLAGVVFARDRHETPESLLRYFSFINSGEPMPSFWQDFDRGTKTCDEVAALLAAYRGSDAATAKKNMLDAVSYQRTVPSTAKLIGELKRAGYRLYVLSNMSREYIDYLRKLEVYGMFEGDVVSCECGLCKPEREIYELLLEKFSLDASSTLFIDDRKENVEAALEAGMEGFHFDRTDPERSCGELRKLLLRFPV